MPGARRSRGRLLTALIGALSLVTFAGRAGAATAPVDDPLFPQQWALAGAPGSIDAPGAWCVSSGAGVLLADVDTGADLSHPDLAGKLVAGERFTGGDGTPSPGGVGDDNGHGTMTTGLMVADTNNGAGIAAVAPAARALVVKVLDASGSGSPTDVAAGIRYAVGYRGAGGERVRVINLSLGGDTPALLAALLGGTDVQDAIADAAAHDVAVVAAAGNGGNGLLSPNEYGRLTGVALVAGATGRNGAESFYSTNGNIFAPGGDSMGGHDAAHEILSTTLGGGYGVAQGTSFAAPIVAGTVALLLATGRYTAATARRQILSSASSPNGVPVVNAATALGGSGACAPAAAPATVTSVSPRHHVTGRHSSGIRRTH